MVQIPVKISELGHASSPANKDSGIMALTLTQYN
jgi:hypothetical protein